jgi:Ser/Thr protein kinase RdoA (MazF antagonist)
VLLRQWPEGTSPAQVDAIAQVLAVMHAGAGDVIPVIRPHATDDRAMATTVKGRQYSAITWLQGRPLGRFGGYVDADGNPITLPLPESSHADEVIVQVAAAIARAHAASEDVRRADLPVYTIATLMERVRKYWFEQRKVLGDKAADERDIRRWLRCGNRIIPTTSDLIRNEPAQLTDTSVVIHTDLWPENILITGQGTERQLTGIVGWRHMSSGSPVLDLAQLTVYMQGWSAALTESIIESYATNRHLRPDQRRLVPAVASLMMVETVGKLLTLNYLDSRMIGHEATSVLRSGMKTLLDSLERITHILAPDIEQTERFNRQRQGSNAGYTPKFPARKGNAGRESRGGKQRRPQK